jgi:uncharacterized membrane protein YqhA
VRRLVELSRYVVIIPVIGSFIGSLVLLVIGSIEVGKAAWSALRPDTDTKYVVVQVLQGVDTFLLATVLLVIGYGLYELFVDDLVQLPLWLEIRTLDDLKTKLIGVVVAVLGVVFLGTVVDARSSDDVLRSGVGIGAVLVSLAVFQWATKSPKPVKDTADAAPKSAPKSAD